MATSKRHVLLYLDGPIGSDVMGEGKPDWELKKRPKRPWVARPRVLPAPPPSPCVAKAKVAAEGANVKEPTLVVDTTSVALRLELARSSQWLQNSIGHTKTTRQNTGNRYCGKERCDADEGRTGKVKNGSPFLVLPEHYRRHHSLRSRRAQR